MNKAFVAAVTGGFLLAAVLISMGFQSLNESERKMMVALQERKAECIRSVKVKRGDLVTVADGTKFTLAEPCYYTNGNAWVIDGEGNNKYIPTDLLTKVEK